MRLAPNYPIRIINDCTGTVQTVFTRNTRDGAISRLVWLINQIPEADAVQCSLHLTKERVILHVFAVGWIGEVMDESRTTITRLIFSDGDDDGGITIWT